MADDLRRTFHNRREAISASVDGFGTLMATHVHQINTRVRTFEAKIHRLSADLGIATFQGLENANKAKKLGASLQSNAKLTCSGSGKDEQQGALTGFLAQIDKLVAALHSSETTQEDLIIESIALLTKSFESSSKGQTCALDSVEVLQDLRENADYAATLTHELNGLLRGIASERSKGVVPFVHLRLLPDALGVCNANLPNSA